MCERAVVDGVDEHRVGCDGVGGAGDHDGALGHARSDEPLPEVGGVGAPVDGDGGRLAPARHEPVHEPLDARDGRLGAHELDVAALRGGNRGGQRHGASVGREAHAVGELLPRLGRVVSLRGVPRLLRYQVVEVGASGEPPEALVGELLGVLGLELGLHGVHGDEHAQRWVGALPDGPVGDVGQLEARPDAPLRPRGAPRAASEGVGADALEHHAVVAVLGRVAVVDGLRPAARLARRDGREEAALRLLVEVLRLVEDEQRAVLAVAAVAGAREELHARAALEAYLLAPERRADAVGGEELTQGARVHQARHLLERLG